MNRRVLPFLLITAAPLLAADPAAEVAAAERAFAARASAETTKAAFLANLAPDAIVFQPGPVNGLEWWKDRPVRPGKLEWGPDFIIAASSGDLALSSGPWRYKNGEGKAVAFGHFATIWERQKDGGWKVKLDLGIGHDEMALPGAEMTVAERHPAARKPNLPITLSAIHAKENSIIVDKDPPAEHRQLRGLYADNVRLLRDDQNPYRGLNAVIDSQWALARLAPGGGGVADSREFVWSWGAYDAVWEKGHYLHVWQPVKMTWKIVFAVYSAIPPEAPSAPAPATPSAPASPPAP